MLEAVFFFFSFFIPWLQGILQTAGGVRSALTNNQTQNKQSLNIFIWNLWLENSCCDVWINQRQLFLKNILDYFITLIKWNHLHKRFYSIITFYLCLFVCHRILRLFFSIKVFLFIKLNCWTFKRILILNMILLDFTWLDFNK